MHTHSVQLRFTRPSIAYLNYLRAKHNPGRSVHILDAVKFSNEFRFNTRNLRLIEKCVLTLSAHTKSFTVPLSKPFKETVRDTVRVGYRVELTPAYLALRTKLDASLLNLGFASKGRGNMESILYKGYDAKYHFAPQLLIRTFAMRDPLQAEWGAQRLLEELEKEEMPVLEADGFYLGELAGKADGRSSKREGVQKPILWKVLPFGQGKKPVELDPWNTREEAVEGGKGAEIAGLIHGTKNLKMGEKEKQEENVERRDINDTVDYDTTARGKES